jgi:hypothetical protein
VKINKKKITVIPPFPMFVYQETADKLRGDIINEENAKLLTDDAVEIIQLKMQGHEIEY